MTSASRPAAVADAPLPAPSRDASDAALAMGTSGAPGFAGSVCERLGALAEPTQAAAAATRRVANAGRDRAWKKQCLVRVDDVGWS
jgi:hypothetical protein